MRQFLLGKNVAYASGDDLLEVADGAVGVFYNENGELKATTTGSEVLKEAMLVLGRPKGKGGPITLPIYKNNFSYVKGEYQAATTFSAEIELPEITNVGTYSIIIAKKGVLFNERNKWTVDFYVKDINMGSDKLAEQLAKAINNNTSGHGVTAVAEDVKITITAVKAGKDYQILPADGLINVPVTVTSVGISAYGDAEYIKDLAMKAAADAGYEYTYRDEVVDLYPSFPMNPLAQPDAEDTGYTIFTLRFAEPRQVKTRDEVVHQIVQVAFPTGADAITTFETVCKTLADEATSADEEISADE